jgi:hypothetical protein
MASFAKKYLGFRSYRHFRGGFLANLYPLFAM